MKYTMDSYGNLMAQETLYAQYAPGDPVRVCDGSTGTVVEPLHDGLEYRVDVGQGERRRVITVDVFDLTLIR